MLAKLSPWSIVYPLLVDINTYEGDSSEELQRILDCLVMKLITDVYISILKFHNIPCFSMPATKLFMNDCSLQYITSCVVIDF